VDSITLKEVLSELDSGRKIPSMTFITADLHKGTGGELITAENFHKHNWLSPAEYRKQQKLQPTSSMIKKDPRHYENSTRNIIMAGSEIRKVHIRLIRTFNGKTVL
jgi:hypothetical protein